MTLFLITLALFLLVATGMAVGYIFQQKTLAGSCGGLGSIGIEKACNCDNPCEKRKERERIAAEKTQTNDELNQIDIRNI